MTHSLTPSIPCINLTSNCNCLGLIPRVWIPLLQTHSPARQILGKVFFHSPGAESCKVKSGFPDSFFFFLLPNPNGRNQEAPGRGTRLPPIRAGSRRAGRVSRPSRKRRPQPRRAVPRRRSDSPALPGDRAWERGGFRGQCRRFSSHGKGDNKRAAQLSDSSQMLLPHVQAYCSPTGAAPRAGTPVDTWKPLRHTRARAPLWEKGSVSPDRSTPQAAWREGGVGEGRRRDGAQPPNSQGGQDTERTGPRGATLGDPQTL